MLPPSERGQDPARQALERGLTAEPSHPLTDDEAEAAEHDPGRAERVYAPASERTPKPPTPGDRPLVEGGVAARREEAYAAAPPAEPPAASPSAPDVAPSSDESSRRPSTRAMVGVGVSLLVVVGAAGTAWLYRRWQRERNRPINRLRRQARRAAAEPTWRVGGLGAALVLVALLGRALRAGATWDGLLDGAATRLHDLTRTRRAPPVEEVRAGRGNIRFPTINPRSVNRVGPVPALAAVRAPVGSVRPPSRRIGGGVGALLALGASAYLAWQPLRGRGSRVSAGMMETAGEPEPEQPAGGHAHAPTPSRSRRGEARVGKEALSRGESIDVPVTREEVFVERRPLERRPADRAIGEGETIAVPVNEERVEVEKAPVMYEEVSVGEHPVEETEAALSEVRREEARVEGDVDVRGDEPRHER